MTQKLLVLMFLLTAWQTHAQEKTGSAQLQGHWQLQEIYVDSVLFFSHTDAGVCIRRETAKLHRPVPQPGRPADSLELAQRGLKYHKKLQKVYIHFGSDSLCHFLRANLSDPSQPLEKVKGRWTFNDQSGTVSITYDGKSGSDESRAVIQNDLLYMSHELAGQNILLVCAR